MPRLSWQGSTLSCAPIKRVTGRPQVGGGRRRAVSGFSAASRRRLLRLLNRLDTRGIRVSFLTLTFSGSPSPTEAKAALRRLTERWRRAYGASLSWIWRFEYQKRGSPHFHLITFGLPYSPQRELQALWEQCTREARSIVHIQAVKNSRHLIAYCSKYIAKIEANAPPVDASLDNGTYLHAEPDVKQGRIWGIHNAEALPFAAERVADVAGDVVRYLAWVADAQSRGRCRAQFNDTWSMFVDDPFRAWRCVLRDGDEINHVTPTWLSDRNYRRDELSDEQKQQFCKPPLRL